MRDKRTGDLIGHVGSLSENQQTVTLAGRVHQIIRRDEEVIVSPVSDRAADANDDTPNYGGRRRPVSESFAAHVRRGCGLDDHDAPLQHSAGGLLWFHFGGEIFAAILREIHPRVISGTALPGIALRVDAGFETVQLAAYDPRVIQRFIAESGIRLLADESLGCFAADLPTATADAFVAEYQVAEGFSRWLDTRIVTRPARPASGSMLGAILTQIESR